MFSFLSLMRVAGRVCLYSIAACLAATLAQAGETTNKIGITMVDIPAGSFQMGSGGAIGIPKEEEKKPPLLGKVSSSDVCRFSDSDALDKEIPRHLVNVKAFQIGKTEITLGQFRQFIAATGYDAVMNKEEYERKKFIRYNAYGDDAAVVNVGFNDAQAFSSTG